MKQSIKNYSPIRDISSLLGVIYDACDQDLENLKGVIETARLAYFHFVQIKLWERYKRKAKIDPKAEVICVVVYSYGEASYPAMILFFKDGTSVDSCFDTNCPSIADFEIEMDNLIFNHALAVEEQTQIANAVQEGK